jgi:hypothetical protein
MITKLTTAHESTGASTTAIIAGSMPPADFPEEGAVFSAGLSEAESDMGGEDLNLSA